MPLQTNSAWWATDKAEGLKARIAQIQKINDPTTNADEILKYGKVLLFVLLAFTGLLGGVSYYKNFSGTFPPEVAAFMALCLTFVIEWGKNYAAKWTLRIPFFRGFGSLTQRPENTFVWIGLLCIAGATFYMSVFNSTIGGHQLATVLSQERNASAFTADTRAIDEQILATQKGIADNQEIKWKGTTTYQAQKAISRQSEALTSLQRQREATVSAQRADWEKSQGQKEANSNYTASLVMASGGWVELLQALLILLIVSCEKSLDSRAGAPSPTPSQKPGIGFQQQAIVTAEQHRPEQPRSPIGFHRPPTPPPPPVPITGLPTVPVKNAVEQRSTAEQHLEQEQEQATAMVADIKEWRKRANQCFGRSFLSQSETARRNNRKRCEIYCTMLEATGHIVVKDYNVQPIGLLEIQEPKSFKTGPSVVQVIQSCKSRLQTIGHEQ